MKYMIYIYTHYIHCNIQRRKGTNDGDRRGTRKGGWGKHERNTKTDMQENVIIKPSAEKQQIKSHAWSSL